MTQLPSPPIFRKGGKDYRRWTQAHKRQIVEETFVPGASVSVVARKHDVNANQIFTWRLQYQRGELGNQVEGPGGFVPVVLAQEGGAVPSVPSLSPPAPVPRTAPSGQAGTPVVRTSRTDIIHLHLRNGVKLKLHAGITPASLRQVLLTLREVL